MSASPYVSLLIGVQLGIALNGFVVGQAVLYLQQEGSTDPRRYRWIVGCLTILIMFHGLALGGDSIIKYAVHGISSGAALELGPAVVSAIIANALVDLIVQTVYAHRVYVVLNRSLWAAVPLALAVLASFGSIIYIAVMQAVCANYIVFLERVGRLTSLCFILPFACDLLITAMMLAGLYKTYHLGSSQGSQKIIRRLFVLTIETNAITTLVQSVTLILYFTTEFWYSLLSGVLPGCYVLTLLLWLNAREKTRQQLHKSTVTPNKGKRSSERKLSFDPRPSLAVRVSTFQEIHIDSMDSVQSKAEQDALEMT